MNRISPVVKNLLIINVVLFLTTYIAGNLNESGNPFWLTNPIVRYLALFFPKSEFFAPHQLITHMFMHGGIAHIFFNMYALWMFGTYIENAWGGKRFLFYYLFTGLGAAALHILVNYFIYSGMAASIVAFTNTPSPELFKQFIDAHRDGFRQEFVNQLLDTYQAWSMNPGDTGYVAVALREMNYIMSVMLNIPTVGASGAVFGILLAFGMMYPNAQLMLIFPPIPLKAKWLVIGYGALELFLGVSQPGSSIAHFAHVGGMLFGLILIRFWIVQSKKRQ